MPLDDLVNVLGRTGDEFLQVLAGSWLLDNPDRAELLRPHAAKLLGAEKLERLKFPRALPGSIAFAKLPEFENGNIPQTRIAFALDTLLDSAPCAPSDHLLGVWFDPDTLVTAVDASVTVARPPNKFREHADPRGWERTAGLFFKTSQLCDPVAGDFQTRPNPPVIGDQDYAGLLLEHVSFGFVVGLPIDTLNVLNVDCNSQKYTPGFDVSLRACLETQFWFSWSRGGLDVDNGMLSTADVTGKTRLRGTKMARFTERRLLGFPVGRLLNYFAPFSLAALMSVLVFGGACYDS